MVNFKKGSYSAGFDQFPNDVSGGSDNNECYMVGSDILMVNFKKEWLLLAIS